MTLRDGEQWVLRGTNDVDRDNRGVDISDPGLGRVVVAWEEFDALTFHPRRGESAAYVDFSGGGPLYGRSDGVDLDIEFARIRSIDKAGVSSVLVTLRDGRTFEIDGSNDVNRGNRGIFVTGDDRRTVLVRWTDFQSLVLAR